MSKSEDEDRPVAVDQTTDLPSAPPHAGPSTARRGDTSLRSDHLQTVNRVGELDSDPSAQTGAFTPPTGQADRSSVTGGYTPSDQPRPAVAGQPAVRGYEILGELGRGGMGVVYKARQIGLDRLVALKMILAGAHARAKDLERFRAEAQAVARFQHPNIVQIYEVGEADGLPYFSLEFVDGGTLAGKVAREPQAPRFAAETIAALARAMQYAHDRDVVHRDLKPANVLLARDGTPKVTDFGLAKRLEQDSGQTQAGTVLGTPSYMAPEQAMGDTARVGPPADVYALGAMLYDLLTGRPPFAGSSVLDTLEMVRTREPVPPGQLTGKLPKDLETICLKCLQKEMGKRYASAGDLADDLRRYLDGRPILARPVGAVERTWRWAKRNPWVAGLGSATAVSLLAVAVVASVMSYRLDERRKEAEARKNDALEAAEAARIAEGKEAAQKRNALAAQATAEKAQKVTGDQRNLALDVVRGISRDVDGLMASRKSLAPLRIQIQQKMLSDLEKIRDHAAKNPLDDRGEAVALAQLGTIYLNTHQLDKAVDHLRRSRIILGKVARDYPDGDEGARAKRNLANISNTLGDARLRQGYTDEAHGLYAAALKLRQEWQEMVPGHVDAKEAVAIEYWLIGRVDLELGDPKSALANFRQSDTEYSELPPDRRARLDTRRDRLIARDGIAESLFRLGKIEEAEKEHRAAYAEREALVKTYPQHPQLRYDLAHSRQSVGDFYLFTRKDVGRALAEYAPAYQEFHARAQADPDDLTAKEEQSALSYRLGYVFDRMADAAPAAGPGLRLTARAFYLECLAARRDLEKADPRDAHAKINLMVVLGRLGQAAEVETMAAELRKAAGADRRVLFQTACGLALAGGGTGPAADRCRDQAFRVLGELVDQGWKDRVGLETDPDLEPARGDKRFADLVARIPK